MEHTVTRHELVGGAELLVVNMKQAVSFGLTINLRSGYRYGSQELFEMAHILEHVVFEGNKLYPNAEQFKLAVEKRGAYVNANTSEEDNNYIYVGGIDDVERLIPIAFAQVYAPMLSQESINQEAGVIRRELAQYKENDNRRLGVYLTASLFPSLRPDIDARAKSLDGINHQNMKEFHEKLYVAANTKIILSGAFSDDRLATIIDHLNHELEGVAVGKKQAVAEIPTGDYSGLIKAYAPYKQSQALFALRFTELGEDGQSLAPLRCLVTMLTGGHAGVLHQAARKAGLTYGIGVSSGGDTRYTAVTTASEATVDKIEPLIKLAAEYLVGMKDGEFSDDQLSHAQGYIKGGIQRSYQTPANYANWYASKFIDDQKLESPDEWIAKIEAVTREDVIEVAKRYITAENMTLILIGKGLEEREDDIRNMLKETLA